MNKFIIYVHLSLVLMLACTKPVTDGEIKPKSLKNIESEKPMSFEKLNLKLEKGWITSLSKNGKYFRITNWTTPESSQVGIVVTKHQINDEKPEVYLAKYAKEKAESYKKASAYKDITQGSVSQINTSMWLAEFKGHYEAGHMYISPPPEAKVSWEGEHTDDIDSDFENKIYLLRLNSQEVFIVKYMNILSLNKKYAQDAERIIHSIH